nr:class I SAM-dependent methyltransferase [Chitinophagales bacterium]
IKPFCKGKILEIGSGIGNISQFLIHDGFTTTLSDYNQSYCDILKEKYGHDKNVTEIIHLDILDPKFEKQFETLSGQFDCIIGLNVIEHVDDDITALLNCKKLLAPGGRIIMLVPAYMWLYNGIDVSLGHFRRYNKKRIKTLFSNTALRSIKMNYFNSPAIFGWYISGRVLKNTIIKEGQMKLYNLLVPLFKLADICTFNRFGISLIAVGEKTQP